MVDLIHIFLSLSSALLAVCIGLWAYKRLGKFHKFLFFQVFVYLIIDSMSIPFMPNNSWLINISIFTEVLLLFAAVQAYFNTTISRRYMLLFLILFLAVYIIDIFFETGFYVFAYHASIVEGILLTISFISILYFQLGKWGNTSYNWSVVLVCLGLVMYFAGSIPYISTLFYFQKINPTLNLSLFRNIIETLAHIRYITLAIGFFLATRPSIHIIPTGN